MSNTNDIADGALIAVQTMLAWEKPSREKLEALLGTRFSCEEREADWTECASNHTSNPAIGACRYDEYRRPLDRTAALSLIIASDSQLTIAELSRLEQTLGAWVGNMDSMPIGAGVNPAEFPIYYRKFPRTGRATVSLRHYRDGRAHSIHIAWAP